MTARVPLLAPPRNQDQEEVSHRIIMAVDALLLPSAVGRQQMFCESEVRRCH